MHPLRSFLVATLLAVSAATGNAHADPRTDYVRLVERAQPPEARDRPDLPNAYEMRLALHERVAPLRESLPRVPDGELFEFATAAIRKGDAEYTAHADRAVKLYEEAGIFRDLETIADTPRAVRPYDGDLLFARVYTESLTTDRHLVRAVMHRFMMQLRSGDQAGAIRSYELCLAQARLLAQQLTRFHASVATGLVVFGNDLLRDAVDREHFDAASLDKVRQAIERQLGHLPSAAAILEAERMIALDAINEAPVVGRLFGSRELNRFFLSAKQLARMSPKDRDSSPAALAYWDAIGTYQNPPLFEEYNWDPTLGLEAHLRLFSWFDTDVQATYLMVRIEHHHLSVGEYPESLGAMPLGEQASLFRGLAGVFPLVYKRGDEGYRLYSVGSDLVDDDGTPAPGDLFEAMHNPTPGSDFVYR